MSRKKQVALPDDLIVLNCSQCGRLIVRKEDEQIGKRFQLGLLAGRVAGRPFCEDCIKPEFPQMQQGRCWNGERVNNKNDGDDNDPWRENAVKELEG